MRTRANVAITIGMGIMENALCNGTFPCWGVSPFGGSDKRAGGPSVDAGKTPSLPDPVALLKILFVLVPHRSLLLVSNRAFLSRYGVLSREKRVSIFRVW